MNGAFNTERRRRRPGINITPLIDVMLLLLIFFMVSSTFRQERGIDVSLPKAGTATEQESPPHVISVDRDGQLFLEGQPVDEIELRLGLQNLLERDPEGAWVLQADSNAHVGRFIRAMDIAREVGGTRLVIPTDFLEQAGSDR